MKVHCPRHDDRVASCEVYDTHAWCFAGCGAIDLKEVGIDPNGITPKPKEDLEASRDAINQLPQKLVRGFSFPYDDRGYYLCWPDKPYYKLRYWEGDLKYKNPSGHTQPLFWARNSSYSPLYVVEGEINALSVAASVYPKGSVVSPGSASNFMSKEVSNNLTLFKRYDKIIIVVDKDPAGTLAAIHLKSILLPHPNISIVLMEQDANDVYLNHGPETLKEIIDTTQM